MFRSRAINTFGMVLTGTVLIIVLITKFLLGAWIAIAAMAVIYVVMLAIRRHYDRVAHELDPTDEASMLPSRNHAVVLVSKVHLPTLRAVSYAQATRPDTLTGLTVNVDEADTRRVQAEWERREVGVPLTVIDSPYREISGPIINYVKTLRADSPRDVVTVFIPEYVVGRWWENLLHNQSALRIKGRLLFEPGVMVTSVPYQLASTSTKDLDRLDRSMARIVPRGPRGPRPNGEPPPSDGAAPADSKPVVTASTSGSASPSPSGKGKGKGSGGTGGRPSSGTGGRSSGTGTKNRPRP